MIFHPEAVSEEPSCWNPQRACRNVRRWGSAWHIFWSFPCIQSFWRGGTDQILQISSSVIPLLLLGGNIMQFDVSGASKGLVQRWLFACRSADPVVPDISSFAKITEPSRLQRLGKLHFALNCGCFEKKWRFFFCAHRLQSFHAKKEAGELRAWVKDRRSLLFFGRMHSLPFPCWTNAQGDKVQGKSRRNKLAHNSGTK